MTACPDAETIALFAEGKLSRTEMRPIVDHVTTCASCMRALKRANERVQAGGAHRRDWKPWLAAAAIVILGLLAIPLVRSRSVSPMDRLVAQSPRSARIVEPRLTGGFAWAPWRGTARAGESSADAQRLKLAGIAGELVERGDAEATADAQHAAGVALLLADKPMESVTRLRDATQRGPNDARAWSDLAAALFAAASRSGRASLYPEALAAADRALRIATDLPEALFNRALILERMGMTQAARETWERYLRADRASPWSTEAREHLQRLSSMTLDMQFRRDLPLIERAVIEGASTRVTELVARHPQQSRLYGEAEYLGLWAEARLRGDAKEAERQLAVARAIGNALALSRGEMLLARAVAAIDRGSGTDTIAEAHALYRRGRMKYGRQQQPAEAEPDLRRAARLFEQAGSPMSLVARYYAACTRFDQNDVAETRAQLTDLLAELDAFPELIALGAQVRWELSLCAMTDDDWNGALFLLREAAASFERIGERNHLGFIRSHLADALAYCGRPDASWESRIESFALQSAEGRRDHFLAVSLGSAMRTALYAGRFDVARSLLELEIAVDRELRNDVLLANALARSAALNTAIGDEHAALRQAEDAVVTAERIADAALRERALQDAQFASGAAMLLRDPLAARGHLTRAIDGYRESDKAFFLPESYLLRSRASKSLGDLVAAQEDLERGIAEIERHRIRHTAAVLGTGVFDAERALFHDAILLALDRGDAARAFAYAEQSRPKVAATRTLAELREDLRHGGAVVLELVVTADEVIAFCITENDVRTTRTRIAEPVLAALAARAAAGDAEVLSRFHDMFLRPVSAALDHARQLIVVTDAVLDKVPFAALYDSTSRRYLIERVPVSFSLNALALRLQTPAVHPPSLMTVSLPEGERVGSIALPQVAQELGDVRALYGRSIDRATFVDLAAAQADVIHIAGHTQVRDGSDEAALGFTAKGGAREWLSWRSVAGKPLASGATVVLAACETLRRPESSQTFALSLGGGFVAAGANDVIGTLSAIGDKDAYRIFCAIHRHLAAGIGAAEAVRRAQLEMLSRHSPQDHFTWAAVGVLTACIHSDEEQER